jgi:hypothetical protein
MAEANLDTTCPGCGAVIAGGGPVHAYVRSSPGCWQLFGELQAQARERPQIVVDTYMVQHPGDGTDRRARQSVFLHLAGLCAKLEHDLPDEHTRRLLERALQGRLDFPVLERTGPGRLNVNHLAGAVDKADYERRAHEWANAVWETWAGAHERIRALVEALR